MQAVRGAKTRFTVSPPSALSDIIFTVTSLDDIDQDLFVKVHDSTVLCFYVHHVLSSLDGMARDREVLNGI